MGFRIWRQRLISKDMLMFYMRTWHEPAWRVVWWWYAMGDFNRATFVLAYESGKREYTLKPPMLFFFCSEHNLPPQRVMQWWFDMSDEGRALMRRYYLRNNGFGLWKKIRKWLGRVWAVLASIG